MASSIDLADYDWLIGPQAAEILHGLAAGDEPLHVLASRLRRDRSATRVHLLLEQIELRRRATTKFPAADRMFFMRLGLEQATDAWVAKFKASRFTGRERIADLCCGIGGDLLALAESASVLAVDRDPVAACFAAANARSVLSMGSMDRVKLQTADVEQLPLAEFSAWHLDPDRRPTGKRSSSIDGGSPNLAAIERLLATSPNAAIKLAPAADVPISWAESCELEWISRDRECRQLVAWHGDLAQSPSQRRATVLHVGWLGSRLGEPPANQNSARTVLGQPNRHLPIAHQLDRFLFEPDPAVLAAHLTGELAAQHKLAAVSPGVAYLTGPAPIDDPALACFEIDDILPLNLRQLAHHLRGRNIGRLEIKKRGVDHDPATVRKALRLTGDDTATLLLTKLNRKHVAILAHRIESGVAHDSLSPVS